MKNILKTSLIFALGLAAGSLATGLLLNRFHRQQLAELYSMQLGGDSLVALQLREGAVDIVAKNFEDNLPRYVVAINADSKLRTANMAEIAFASTKRFYVCTKTEIPTEIAAIMEPVKAMPCNASEE